MLDPNVHVFYLEHVLCIITLSAARSVLRCHDNNLSSGRSSHSQLPSVSRAYSDIFGIL